MRQLTEGAVCLGLLSRKFGGALSRQAVAAVYSGTLQRLLRLYLNTKRTLKRWLLRRLRPCQEMVPLMSASMERRLGLCEHLKLRLHLLVCAWCARYLKQIRFLRQIIRRRTSVAILEKSSSDSLHPAVRERIAESLRQHGRANH